MVGSDFQLRDDIGGSRFSTTEPSFLHLCALQVAKVVRLFIFKHARGETIKRKGGAVICTAQLARLVCSFLYTLT